MLPFCYSLMFNSQTTEAVRQQYHFKATICSLNPIWQFFCIARKNKSDDNLPKTKEKLLAMEAHGPWFYTVDCAFFLSGHIFFKDIVRGFARSHMFTLHKMDYKFPHSFCKAHQERHAMDYSSKFTTTVPMLPFHRATRRG